MEVIRAYPFAVNPLTLLTWRTAVWASDPAWSHPSEGGAVDAWRDGGTADTPLTQSVAARRPLWSATSFAGKPGVTFDGTNDTLGASLSGVSGTYSVVAIMRMVTVPDGVSTVPLSLQATAIGTMYAFCPFRAISNANYTRLRGTPGGTPFVSYGPTDTDAHLWLAVGRPTGTQIEMGRDGINVASSSTSGAPSAPDAFWLGAQSDASAAANVVVAFAGVFPGDITADPNWAAFKAWVATNYALTIA